MEEAAEGLVALPLELLSLIFCFFKPQELYPSSFLICKRLLRAVLDEHSWRERCVTELDITEKPTDLNDWKQTYHGQCAGPMRLALLTRIQIIENSLIVWDPKYCTVGPKERERLKEILRQEHGPLPLDTSSIAHSHEAFEEVLELNKNIVTWRGGYVPPRRVRQAKNPREGHHG